MSLTRAAMLLKSGAPAQAIPYLRAALARDPANAALAHDLGLACLEAGEIAEAIATLRQSAALSPRSAATQFRLGAALEAGNYRWAALQAYDAATALKPAFTEAWYRAGALAFTMGHRAEALGCFARAAAGGAKTGFGKLAAARRLIIEGREREAAARLRHLLALDPRNAVAADLLGNLLAEAGDFEEAQACFARALAHAPRMAGTWYDFVRCRRLSETDRPLVQRMSASLGEALHPEQRLRLHLAIGKAHQDLGEFAAALQHFGAAGALRAQLAPFDITLFEQSVAQMIAHLTQARIAEAAARGNPSRRPVLVMGMPRSGTTLTEQILAAHPAVAAGGEMNFWTARGAAWFRDGMPCEAGGAFLTAAAEDYLRQLQALPAEADHVTDKMPFNFLWAGLIHMALPEARLVLCRRGARDTALSIHQTHFSLQLAFPTGGDALVRYMRCHDRLAAHWREVLPADRLHELPYEAMTMDPQAKIERLLAFAGLPWSPLCLHPERNSVSIKTASRHQARAPIGRGSVGNWRRYAEDLGFLAALNADPAPIGPG